MNEGSGNHARHVVQALLAVISRDWTRIDAAWERTRRPHGIHIRRDTALDQESFLLEALAEAQRRRILHVFIRELNYEGLLTESDLHAISRLPEGPTWELQAFQNGVFIPINALLYGKNLIAACDQVCRIDVDGYQAGTGVQVSATLVATAAHVLEPLITVGPDGAFQAAHHSLGRLSVTFCYAEDFKDEESLETQRNDGVAVPLHHRWLVWGSGRAISDDPHSGLGVSSISGISSTGGPWDLAFIRLAERREKRRPIQLLPSDPPANPFQINILHHPNGQVPTGQPLLLSEGQLRKHLAHLGQPPVRCLHDASTSPGSSGAPIFDSHWRIVALHQGGVPPGAHGMAEGENRAIPVGRWRDQLASVVRSLSDDGPYLTELKTSTDLVPNPYPVIGRRETQRHVLRAMQPDASPQERLLIIRGEPGTGRRFTKRLVREMVSGTDGVAAILDMANGLDHSASEFIQRVAGAFSAEFEPPDLELLTTEQRAIHDDLVPLLGQLLDNVAGDRPVWLVLEGFGDVFAPIPAALTNLVGGLIERLPDFPSVRLVLVGWTSNPPGYENSVENLRPPTADDVIWYLHPAGEVPDIKMVWAIEADFEFAASRHAVNYPFAQRKALELREMLSPQIDPGDGP